MFLFKYIFSLKKIRKRGLEIIGEVSDMHCSCGYEGPGFITREVQLDNGRPSMN